MLTTIRTRLSEEDGLSLVEMMVALVVVTVALLGLLGVLLSSARAVLQQDLRNRATRVMTTELEQVRARGYDALPVGTDERTHEIGGVQFVARTLVEWADATDVADADRDLKQVTTTVRWSVGGRVHTTTATTALRRPAGTSEDTTAYRVEVLASRTTIEVDQLGVPTAGLAMRATPHGFAHVGPMAVTWENGDGSEGSATLGPETLHDQGAVGGAWVGTVLPTDVRMPLDPDTTVTVPFTVRASGHHETVDIVFVRGPAPPPEAPVLSEPSVVSGDGVGVIGVRPPSAAGDCLSPACHNDSAVTASVRTAGGDAEVTVAVEYDTRDADGVVSTPLERVGDGYQVTFPAGDVAFSPGLAQPFTFVVTYGRGQVWRTPVSGGVHVEER